MGVGTSPMRLSLPHMKSWIHHWKNPLFDMEGYHASQYSKSSLCLAANSTQEYRILNKNTLLPAAFASFLFPTILYVTIITNYSYLHANCAKQFLANKHMILANYSQNHANFSPTIHGSMKILGNYSHFTIISNYSIIQENSCVLFTSDLAFIWHLQTLTATYNFLNFIMSKTNSILGNFFKCKILLYLVVAKIMKKKLH